METYPLLQSTMHSRQSGQDVFLDMCILRSGLPLAFGIVKVLDVCSFKSQVRVAI